MSDPSSRIVAYVEEQLRGIQMYPLMWGPPIAVELAYLQLLETLLVTHRPDLDATQPQFIKEQYSAFLDRRFPDLGAGFLSSRLKEDQIGKLVEALRDFDQEVREVVHPLNPYEEYELALRLRLREGVTRPSSTTVTSYLEVFRRILRATLKGPERRGGRSRAEIETLTEFELPAIDVRQANGVPASVTFPLIQRHAHQTSLLQAAEREVRDSVGHLTAMIEWVESERPVAELSALITDPQRRQTVAAEALRLVPRGEVEVVELGGALVSRYSPVSLRPTAKPRLVEAISENRSSEEFAKIGQIHALDIDRSSFRLHVGRAKHQCLLSQPLEDALSDWRVESDVKVEGRQYQGILGKAVVIVESLFVVNDGQGAEEQT